MTAPLSDPVLEAGVQIQMAIDKAAGYRPQLAKCRKFMTENESMQRECRAMIAESARQIDALRAAGVIPKGGE